MFWVGCGVILFGFSFAMLLWYYTFCHIQAVEDGIQAGQVWEFRYTYDSPWKPTLVMPVYILETRDGWVRYIYTDGSIGEHEISTFNSMPVWFVSTGHDPEKGHNAETK